MIVISETPSATGEALEAALRASGLNPEAPPLHVNWTGGRVTSPERPVLNSESSTNKLQQLIRLELAGLPVPKFVITKPKDGLAWFPRRAFHQQGRDFRFPPKKPDFWTKYINIDEEWRIHVFRSAKGNLRVIRSARKVPKGPSSDPIIRSHRVGWKLSYTGGAPEGLKEVAKQALAALRLDFGAVDIGLTFEAKPVLLEVNTCPGLESGTLSLYVAEVLKRAGRKVNAD